LLNSERRASEDQKSQLNTGTKTQKSFLSSFRSKNIQTDLKTLNFIKQKLKCVSNNQVITAFEKFYDHSKELTTIFESVKAVYTACHGSTEKSSKCAGSSKNRDLQEVSYFEIWDNFKGIILDHYLNKTDEKTKRVNLSRMEEEIEGEDCPAHAQITKIHSFRPQVSIGQHLSQEFRNEAGDILKTLLDDNLIRVSGKGCLDLFKKCRVLLQKLESI